MVEAVSLENEMKRSFMSYAMSTILSRALPDARDGLKPVHRRILFGMRELKLAPSGPFRKCARVVGEVLGKFHPHGDGSVYDALVRMTQNWVMSAPLVNGHGNFGSIDADPAAAMRYTECRLTKLAAETLLNKEDLGTRRDSDPIHHGGICVDLVKNFDESEREPLVLPARVPILLVNGASGIAVGMSTNIPPHNLGEICEAAAIVVDFKRTKTTKSTSDVDTLLAQAVPGPDFPTGGTIMGTQGIKSLYKTGNGAVVVRAKYHVETKKTGRKSIIVTELPYQVTKGDLVKRTYEQIKDKKLEGVAEVKDESGRDGIRVVYDLKKDAQEEVVLNALFKQTRLQSNIPGNMVAVDNDPKTGARTPKRFSLRSALESWLTFRFGCVRARASYNEARLSARLNIVDGLLIANSNIDKVVTLIRSADSPANAKQALISTIGLDDAQADAVLALRLSSLTKLERSDLDEEKKTLSHDLVSLRDLLVNDDAVYDVIEAEVLAVKKAHGVDRRTVIDADGDNALELRDEAFVPNARSAVLVGNRGYVKRIPLNEFANQGRGGRGRATLANGDVVDEIATCHDHDTLLCVADTGIAYGLRTFDVPTSSRSARGTPLQKLVPALAGQRRLSGLVPHNFGVTADDSQKRYMLLLTRSGLLKKTPLDAFDSLTNRGLTAIVLRNDTLGWAKLCTDDDEIIIATAMGRIVKFKASDLKPAGRTSQGSKAMKLKEDDSVAAVDVKRPGQDQLVVMTQKGYGKRMESSDFDHTKMKTQGVKGFNRLKAGDFIASLCCCTENDDIMISTRKGIVVRQRTDGIAVKTRTASGVLVQSVTDDPKAADEVTYVSVVPPDLLESDNNSSD